MVFQDKVPFEGANTDKELVDEPKKESGVEYGAGLFDGIPIYSVPTVPFVTKECTLTRSQHIQRVVYQTWEKCANCRIRAVGGRADCVCNCH